MAKIKLQVSLENVLDGVILSSFLGKGLLQDGEISYFENNLSVKLGCKDEEVIITRKNAEYDMTLFLELNKKRNGIFHLKNPEMVLSLETFTEAIKMEKNQIEVHYTLTKTNETEQLLLKVKYEVIK